MKTRTQYIVQTIMALSLLLACLPIARADEQMVRVLRTEEITKSTGENIDLSPGSAIYDPIAKTAGDRMVELLKEEFPESDFREFTGSGFRNFYVKDVSFAEEKITYVIYGISEFPIPLEDQSPAMIAESATALTFLNGIAEREAVMFEQETEDLLKGAAAFAAAHPNYEPNIRAKLGELTDCIRANATNRDPACEAELDAYLAAVDGFTDELVGTAEEVVRLTNMRTENDNCKEGDILCSPVNLLIDPTDPYRGNYINRIRTEGFQVLFLSIVSGLSLVVASIAVLGLLYGAFLYVTSHGDEDQIGKAKQFITLTLTGLVLIIFAYAILVGVRDVFYAPI